MSDFVVPGYVVVVVCVWWLGSLPREIFRHFLQIAFIDYNPALMLIRWASGEQE